MTKFNAYYLNRLPNREFHQAYSKILSRLEGDEFEVEDMQTSFELAKSHLPKLKLLRERRIQHPLTKEILNLKKIRHDALISFKGRVTKSLKSPVKLEQKAAESLDLFLYVYRSYFTSPTLNSQNIIIEEMKYDMEERPSLLTEMESLGLEATWGFIKTLTLNMGELYLTRDKEIKAEKEKATLIRNEAYEAIKTFITTIDVAIKLKKGVKEDHLANIRTIDVAMSDFKRDFLSRSTRKKNLALAEAEKEKEDEQTQGDETPVIAMRMTGMVMNGNGGQTMMPTPSIMGNEEAADGGLMDGSANNGDMVTDDGLMRRATLRVQPEKAVSSNHEDVTTNESDKSQ